MAQKPPQLVNATPELRKEATSSTAKPQLLLLLPPNVIGNNLVVLPQAQNPSIPKPYFQLVKAYVSDPAKKAPHVCRTCCRAIFNKHFIKLYDTDNQDNSERLRRMMKEVNPFVDLEIYSNPVMCTKCVQMLFDSYEFKTKCLEAEQRFNEWVSRRREMNSTEVNLLIKVESSTDGDIIENMTKGRRVSIVGTNSQQPQNDVQDSVNSVALDHDYVGNVVVAPNVKKKIMFKSLSHHERVYKPKKQKPAFLCEKCGQLGNHHPSLHAHCTDGAVFKCRHCDYMVRDLAMLETHLQKHISHTCRQCNKNFTSLKLLRTHIIATHLRKVTFSCHICGKIFRHRYSLRKHIAYHDSAKVKRISCEKCQKTFKYEKNYVRHLRRHNNALSSCGSCGKGFFREDNLKKHIDKVHTNNNKDGYVCAICESRSSTEEDYIKHLKRHEMQKFCCKICAKTFKGDRALTAHLQLSHGDKGEYKCQICQAGFWKREYLVEHGLKVHQVRPEIGGEAGKEETKVGFEEKLLVDKIKENVVERTEV